MNVCRSAAVSTPAYSDVIFVDENENENGIMDFRARKLRLERRRSQEFVLGHSCRNSRQKTESGEGILGERQRVPSHAHQLEGLESAVRAG